MLGKYSSIMIDTKGRGVVNVDFANKLINYEKFFSNNPGKKKIYEDIVDKFGESRLDEEVRYFTLDSRTLKDNNILSYEKMLNRD